MSRPRARERNDRPPTIERPPHYARVRALLGALDAPVVQLWGWPGTGKRAILQGLLLDEPGAVHVPAAWLQSLPLLEERLRRKVGRRPALLIVDDPDRQEGLDAVASLLAPGQRLLVAGESRIDSGRPSLATPPEQLLLRSEEIGALWLQASGQALTGDQCEWLRERSGGWHLPLALWARDPAIAKGPFADDERFANGPLEGFLRERVLAPLAPEEIALLAELSARDGVAWRDFVDGGDRVPREAMLRRMIERRALPMVEDDRLRLPPPLAALLAVETRRRSAAGAGSAATSAVASTPDSTRAAATPDPVDVRIVLLGVPRVERRDASGQFVPVIWSFKRPLRILAYLASAPDLQASREEIVSILWPEMSEDAIQRNLHPAVSWLRRSVWPGGSTGGVVLLRDGVYSLDPSLRWEVDVRSFLERIENGARHLARGRVEEAEPSWEAAWRLYHGAFLQGWSDRWVLAQRDELQLRFTDLLRRLGDLRASLGRLTEAEDAYRTLLLEDPLEEGVHVSIMRIYAARGRRDLVNRQYQRLRDVLLQELSVEPSPPTRDAFNEIMLAPSRDYR